MKNPCLNCDIHLSGTDKKNHEQCRDCDARVAYVASMGGMTHSLPDRHCDLTHRDPVRPRRKDKGVEMETEKRLCSGGCGRRLEVNADNFGRSAKAADGFMKMCKECHAKRIAEGHQRVQKRRNRMVNSDSKKTTSGSPPPKAGIVPAEYKTAEKGATKKPLCLTIDFSNHSGLLSVLQKIAAEEMRTPEMQVLYLIKMAYRIKMAAPAQDQEIPF